MEPREQKDETFNNLYVIAIWFLALSALFVTKTGHGKPFRLYMNPDTAERTLASVRFKPRLVGEAWTNLIGPRSSESYTVRPGDNLWNIAGKNLNNPWLWPKLWATNNEITNPHEISVGQSLKFHREMSNVERELASGAANWETEEGVPVIKLRPSGNNGGTNLEEDAFVTPQLPNRYTRTTVVLTPADKPLGSIVGAYYERENIMEHDNVYARFEKPSEATEGETFTVLREEKEVSDPVSGEELGILCRVVGEVQVRVASDKLTQLKTVSITGQLRRGDLIVSRIEPVEFLPTSTAPDKIEAYVVATERIEADTAFEGETVLLNQGEEHGVEAGQLYRVYDDEDPFEGSTDVVDPWFHIEIQIIMTDRKFSVGYVRNSQRLVTVGDKVLPSQSFPDSNENFIELKAQETLEIPD